MEELKIFKTTKEKNLPIMSLHYENKQSLEQLVNN